MPPKTRPTTTADGYETLSTQEKRQILQERLHQLERRHYDTVMNLQGAQAIPHQTQTALQEILGLEEDIANLWSLIEFNRQALRYLG